MRRALFAVLLVTAVSAVGCEITRWATTADPATGKVPAVEAGKEIVSDTLTGFETGGIAAGILALVFTTAKTGIRLYSAHQKSKATNP